MMLKKKLVYAATGTSQDFCDAPVKTPEDKSKTKAEQQFNNVLKQDPALALKLDQLKDLLPKKDMLGDVLRQDPALALKQDHAIKTLKQDLAAKTLKQNYPTKTLKQEQGRAEDPQPAQQPAVPG